MVWPLRQPHAIRRYLEKLGIKFVLTPGGMPLAFRPAVGILAADTPLGTDRAAFLEGMKNGRRKAA